MSLEEATRWLMAFDSYLAWNESVIDRKSPKCLESQLDTSLLSRMAKDESVTEKTTVRGSAGILNILKGYFVKDSSQQHNNTRPRSTNEGADNSEEGRHGKHKGESTSVSQYQNWTTVELSNPVQSAWIFQAYLRQVAAIAQRIKLSISRWRKDRSKRNGDRTTSELEELRTDMLGQLSNIEESWSEAMNDDERLQTDAAEEKKTLARTVRDSRSWGREGLGGGNCMETA
jgi:hypothetical protein